MHGGVIPFSGRFSCIVRKSCSQAFTSLELSVSFPFTTAFTTYLSSRLPDLSVRLVACFEETDLNNLPFLYTLKAVSFSLPNTRQLMKTPFSVFAATNPLSKASICLFIP